MLAIAASAADFDDRPWCREARALRCLAHAFAETVVVDVHRLSAGVADQEDAVVQAARVLVRDIGVRALDPASEVCPSETSGVAPSGR